MVSRGKEELVLIRPYQRGLVLNTMYYSHEVREFEQVPKAENVRLSKQEINAGIRLIDKLTRNTSSPKSSRTNTVFACARCSSQKPKGKRSSSASGPCAKAWSGD